MQQVTVTIEVDTESYAEACVTVADRLRSVVEHDRKWDDVIRLEHQPVVVGFVLVHTIEAP